MPDPAACLTCTYLAAEAERWRALAEVGARIADARLLQARNLQTEVEILRALNESLSQRIAAAEGLLAAQARRN